MSSEELKALFDPITQIHSIKFCRHTSNLPFFPDFEISGVCNGEEFGVLIGGDFSGHTLDWNAYVDGKGEPSLFSRYLFQKIIESSIFLTILVMEG